MPRLLLLIPTKSYRIGDFIDAARKVGAEVCVGSDEAQVLAAFSEGRTLSVDFGDPAGSVEVIVHHGENDPFQAIIGVDEQTGLIAAEAAARLGLPHNPPEAVLTAGNKHLFRERLKEAGLPSPRFRTFPIDADPRDVAVGLDYPCVLKPLDMSASRGVLRADNAAEFRAAFARVGAIVRENDGTEILVEDFIPGREVALEGLLEDGVLAVLAIFDKPDPLDGPTFEESIYVTPSRLDAETQAEITRMTERAVAALGLRDGPVHAELRIIDTEDWVNEKGPWMIEVAARSIGGLCGRALRFGGDATLEELIVRHALGLGIESRMREEAAAGVMMIPIPKAGTLKRIDGLETARAVAGIDDITISIPIGQDVIPLPEGSKYLGFIFARRATPGEAEAALREAHAALTILIE